MQLFFFCTVFQCNVFAQDKNYKDKITIGSFPQTLVTDESLLEKLNSDTSTALKLEGYAYYYAAEYIDRYFEGNQYRAIKVTEGRPMFYDEMEGESFQNSFKADTWYWFQYEPMTFSHLGNGIYLCDTVIDSECYRTYKSSTYDLRDKGFDCLTKAEVRTYSSSVKMASGTDYAKIKGLHCYDEINNYCSWLLQDEASNANYMVTYNPQNDSFVELHKYATFCGIRPVYRMTETPYISIEPNYTTVGIGYNVGLYTDCTYSHLPGAKVYAEVIDEDSTQKYELSELLIYSKSAYNIRYILTDAYGGVLAKSRTLKVYVYQNFISKLIYWLRLNLFCNGNEMEYQSSYEYVYYLGLSSASLEYIELYY